MSHRLACAAVLLDCDGVLVDSDASVTRTWTRWATRYGLDPAEVVPGVHGRPAAETVAAWLPPSRCEQALRLIVAMEREDADSVTALPGAREILDSLGAGCWAVVTSGESVLARSRIRAADLRVPDVLVTADDVVRGKPDPQPYLLAAERLGVPPTSCVVVEDAPAGVAAARAARAAGVLGVGPRARALDVDLAVPDLRGVRFDGSALVVPADDGS
ncbi:MAG TPA: HAD-IA family hydrolase [Actinomycetes bacterium]|nr:HAD-IA family hydrolase [Actinomycetes bacterium]